MIRHIQKDDLDKPPVRDALPDWNTAHRRPGVRLPWWLWLALPVPLGCAALGLLALVWQPAQALGAEFVGMLATYRDHVRLGLFVGFLATIAGIVGLVWRAGAAVGALGSRARVVRLSDDTPVDAELLRRPEWGRVAEGVLLEHHVTQRAWADKSGGRGLTTYAPAFHNRQDVQQLEGTPAPALLPPPLDMAALGHTPRPDAILLAVDAAGPITVPAPALWHVATAGPTGNGKSNFHRLMMAQLLAMGARVAVGDPKWTAYDAQQDEDWRPIARRLALAPAVTAPQVADLLSWSAEELQRRLDARRDGHKPGGPYFLVLDELPWIFEHVKGSDRAIGELVRLGRGVGLFVMAAAQDFLVKTTGLSGARDNFRTCAYLGGDLKTGSVLLDIPQKDLAPLESQLGVGLAVLRSAATSPPRIVRIPYMSNAALYQMLGDAPADGGIGLGALRASQAESQRETQRPFGFHAAPMKPGENPHETQVRNPENLAGMPQTPTDPTVARILALWGAGKSIGEIVKAIHGEISGPKYNKARDEVETVIRLHWKGTV